MIYLKRKVNRLSWRLENLIAQKCYLKNELLNFKETELEILNFLYKNGFLSRVENSQNCIEVQTCLKQISDANLSCLHRQISRKLTFRVVALAVLSICRIKRRIIYTEIL